MEFEDTERKGFHGFYPNLFSSEEQEALGFSFNVHQVYRSEEDQQMYGTGTSAFPVYMHLSEWGSEGLNLSQGYNFWETYSLELHYRHIAAEASLRAGWSEDEASWTQWQRLYVETRFRKFIFSIGRKPLRWGQSFVSPILVGNNAQSLDQINITNIPVNLFTWSSWKAEVFLSRMDADRVPAHDYLAGWRIGSLWFERFELNLGMLYQFKGAGLPGASAKTYALEFLGVRSGQPREDELQAGGNSDVTNRAVAMDWRINFQDWFIPFDFYSEQHLEDCCGSPSTIYKKSYNFLYGFSFYLEKDHRLGDFEIEFIKTAWALYHHHRWKSALSNRGQLLGHPLGADSIGLYSRWTKWSTQFHFFYEKRRRSENIVEGLRITAYHPDFEGAEERYSLGFVRSQNLLWNWQLELGAWSQYVRRPDFRSGSAWEFMASTGLSYVF